ncbi:hypothetical protein P9281_01505 [Caballeronia sp. LP003]|uniref:hypothetical protein n=1 Tax=Caballeronia sp. LP003 TaxID=3038551 RepID=UPI00285BC20E|nr:hypothetical protein [Caballeronia sp. LP003]MDR5785240.1 hypothetical protein [Caballeronia sp. LP003]
MSATTTRTSNPTNEPGVPPGPSEAHQRTYAEGDIRVVIVAGSRIQLQFHEGRWLSVAHIERY